MASVNFLIRPADPKIHSKDLEILIRELAEFEQMSNGPQLKAERLQSDLEQGCFGAFVAILEEKYGIFPANTVVGYLIYYNAYSTWEGQHMFIEDIYVKPELRRFGIGTSLWNTAAKLANENGFPRIEFNVLAWNENALQFYKRMGSQNLYETEGWIRFRLDKTHIEKLADRGIKSNQ